MTIENWLQIIVGQLFAISMMLGAIYSKVRTKK